MAADAAAPGFELRLGKAEWQIESIGRKVDRNSERVGQLERQQATATQIHIDLKSDVESLQRTLDRLVWAVVGLALTIAGSAIGIAIMTAAGSG